MKGMLKEERFKFFHSHSLWVIIGVLVASCGISIVTGTYNSAEVTLANLIKDCMVPILACAIYSAIQWIIATLHFQRLQKGIDYMCKIYSLYFRL